MSDSVSSGNGYTFDGPYRFCGGRRVGVVTPDGLPLYLYDNWPAWWSGDHPDAYAAGLALFDGPDTPMPSDDIAPLERRVSNLAGVLAAMQAGVL